MVEDKWIRITKIFEEANEQLELIKKDFEEELAKPQLNGALIKSLQYESSEIWKTAFDKYREIKNE